VRVSSFEKSFEGVEKLRLAKKVTTWKRKRGIMILT